MSKGNYLEYFKDVPSQVSQKYVAVTEEELYEIRNLLANLYMDTPHTHKSSEVIREGLDLVIRIMEEYYGQDAGKI